MMSFNTAKAHDELVNEAIEKFRKDHRALVAKHPDLWQKDDWVPDPAPKYAQQLVGEGRGGFTVGQTRLARATNVASACIRDMQGLGKVQAEKLLGELTKWIVETCGGDARGSDGMDVEN